MYKKSSKFIKIIITDNRAGMMMMREEEESKEEVREREKKFDDEKEKKKSSVDDERSRLKSNNNHESQNDGDGSIPESVLKEFEEFLKDNNNESKNNNSITFSETQLSLPVRVLIHQMVKEKGKNMLGSRTISETNQIRAFRKKDYFSNKEGDEDKEEDKEEEEQQRTRFERGNIELNDAFDFFLELKLKTKNGGRSSSSSLKINADVARSKYHKLSQRLHPSYNAASSGRKRGWCDQCGMLLELGRWYRFTTTTGSRSRSGEKDEQNGGETADDLTDICRVCLEKKKKNVRRNFSTNKGRRDETENAYLEMEKNGELVLIKDLSAFGEKGSELREMYCCSLNDDESDDEREKSNNNNNNKKKTILLTRAHKATLDFKKLTVAYLCFKDPSRTEIYKTFGFDQLKKHEENYSDVNIFECDPWEVYEDFFEGKDEDDRQYLLFNGVDLESSDSDLEEDMMVEEEAEEEKEEEEEDMDDDSEEDLNLLKQAKEMAKQQQQQKKVIMSKSTSANEVLKFPFYQPGGVGGTHNRFVDNDDNEEDDEKKEDIWSTTISKAAV